MPKTLTTTRGTTTVAGSTFASKGGKRFACLLVSTEGRTKPVRLPMFSSDSLRTVAAFLVEHCTTFDAQMMDIGAEGFAVETPTADAKYTDADVQRMVNEAVRKAATSNKRTGNTGVVPIEPARLSAPATKPAAPVAPVAPVDWVEDAETVDDLPPEVLAALRTAFGL